MYHRKTQVCEESSLNLPTENRENDVTKEEQEKISNCSRSTLYSRVIAQIQQRSMQCRLECHKFPTPTI